MLNTKIDQVALTPNQRVADFAIHHGGWAYLGRHPKKDGPEAEQWDSFAPGIATKDMSVTHS